jgi:hypothetical protein
MIAFIYTDVIIRRNCIHVFVFTRKLLATVVQCKKIDMFVAQATRGPIVNRNYSAIFVTIREQRRWPSGLPIGTDSILGTFGRFRESEMTVTEIAELQVWIEHDSTIRDLFRAYT